MFCLLRHTVRADRERSSLREATATHVQPSVSASRAPVAASGTRDELLQPAGGLQKNKENLGVAIFAKQVPPILQITVDMFCCPLGARLWNRSVWVQQRLRASDEKVGVAVLGGRADPCTRVSGCV